MVNPVENWFGSGFDDLDPLIQNLHRNGGRLQGKVELQFGNGLAGIIGRRLAKKVGLPTAEGEKELEVEIKNENGSLFWSRQFDKENKMISIFTPTGNYPSGYWRENTGVIAMDLGVRVIEGGWYWQQRAIWFKSIRLPLWLFPSSHAYKKIVDGKYQFSVNFSLPVIGKLLSYSGKLNVLEREHGI